MKQPASRISDRDLAKMDAGVAAFWSGADDERHLVIVTLSAPPTPALAARLAELGLGGMPAAVCNGSVDRAALAELLTMPEVVEVADGAVEAFPS